MKNLIFLSLAFLISLAAEANRGAKREHRQDARINQGVQSGQLTEHEANRLQHGQKKIDAYQNKAHSDGEISASEQLKLEHMQDRQSKKIYRQKHDQQEKTSVEEVNH